MDPKRRCTKSSCEGSAVATLTYSYADSTIVVGPISVYAEPHSYDLCAAHADAVSPPRFWEILRLDYSAAAADDDDLLALAEAVREPRRQRDDQQNRLADQGPSARQAPAPMPPPEAEGSIARGHLRMLRD
ncbi:DUF3499 family protein [Garicola koreensis]|uniref:DUF3499 family protein n=1 Tax=Garicola koreensis TaxID=1262554 RepID=UPI00161FC54A